MYAVTWDGNHREFEAVDGVELLLDRLHAGFFDRPTLVSVERTDTGDSLSIGLGADLSVLNFVRGDKDPPYFTSSGGSDADETISFLFEGDMSEYPLRAAVPTSSARAAMRCFCETGELSKDVKWEEV